jgi:hypothetical protein
MSNVKADPSADGVRSKGGLRFPRIKVQDILKRGGELLPDLEVLGVLKETLAGRVFLQTLREERNAGQKATSNSESETFDSTPMSRG